MYMMLSYYMYYSIHSRDHVQLYIFYHYLYYSIYSMDRSPISLHVRHICWEKEIDNYVKKEQQKSGSLIENWELNR